MAELFQQLWLPVKLAFLGCYCYGCASLDRESYIDQAEHVSHIPEPSCTDAGIAQLIEEAKPTNDVPGTAIAHNVEEPPESIEQHDEAMRKREK